MGFNSFEEMPVLAKGNGNCRKNIYNYRKLASKRRLRLDVTSKTISTFGTGNIAEGFGRKHTKDKLNFYFDSRGSLSETKNYLIYGLRVGYINQSDYDDLNS